MGKTDLYFVRTRRAPSKCAGMTPLARIYGAPAPHAARRGGGKLPGEAVCLTEKNGLEKKWMAVLSITYSDRSDLFSYSLELLHPRD